jgi:hypothetical protein
MIRTGFASVLLAIISVGCGGQSSSRYFPAEPIARRALETALTAWQDGQGPGQADTGPPVIQVVDTHRRPGQTLESYEILGEVMADGPRCYTVRLSLDNPSEEQKVRFVVLGIDPLWVFRQEEFEMILHWECFEPTAKKTIPGP